MFGKLPQEQVQNYYVERDGNVRFGSLADVASRPRHVRSTPESGHQSDIATLGGLVFEPRENRFVDSNHFCDECVVDRLFGKPGIKVIAAKSKNPVPATARLFVTTLNCETNLMCVARYPNWRLLRGSRKGANICPGRLLLKSDWNGSTNHPMRTVQKLSTRCFGVGILLIGGSAAAQQQPTHPAAPRPPPSQHTMQPAPQLQSPAQDEAPQQTTATYGDWVVQCVFRARSRMIRLRTR
jgi:hypothetical protein